MPPIWPPQKAKTPHYQPDRGAFCGPDGTVIATFVYFRFRLITCLSTLYEII